MQSNNIKNDSNQFEDGSTDVASSDVVPRSSLLTCSFNQDGGCLAIGTTSGFSVHNLYPQYAVSVNHDSASPRTTETPAEANNDSNTNANTSSNSINTNKTTAFLNGGVGLVELLFRCNIMLLVGGGPNPHSPPHRVLIWDDHLAKAIGELSFRQTVLSVKLRKDSIAVALRDRCYVYDLSTLTLRDKIYTDDNPHGLLCLSTQIHDMVLACPAVSTGHVRVELYGLRKTVLMEAHGSSLRALALTADGSKLATASEKGTVIRIFDVSTAACIQEYRRGYERASIKCLAWSWDYLWLACCSDKGTTHIFQHGGENNANDDKNNNHSNKTSSSAVDTTAMSLTSMIFSSVRKSVEGDYKKSVCQIRGVPHPVSCAFIGEAPTIQLAVAGWDADGNGVLLISEYTPTPNLDSNNNNSISTTHNNNNEAKRIGYHVLCRSENSNLADESEDTRRRRRLMRGWIPEVPATPEGGKLYVGERLELLSIGGNGREGRGEVGISIMEQICFEENENEFDEFVSVTTTATVSGTGTTANAQAIPINNNKTKHMNCASGGGDSRSGSGSINSNNNNNKQILSPLQYASTGSPSATVEVAQTPQLSIKSSNCDIRNKNDDSNDRSSSRDYSSGGGTAGDSSIRTEPIDDDNVDQEEQDSLVE